MQKEFDRWNTLKKRINDNSSHIFFKEREVWFINMGANVRFEQDGKGDKFLRPVLVIKKFNKEMFWGLPCTGSKKQGKYYKYIGNINNKENSVILSQLRILSSARLVYKIGSVSENVFLSVLDQVKDLISETQDGVKVSMRKN